ncbi:GNAT family N-acetyltransferase [Alkaliphilus transvaalensis]|uniref:GNAT family N-acetyltransferase n=1 Tax=Alkaliphilus transvaalensis TaxID=114628 RepID=UPI00047DAC2A|nr:GNAT family N-acetyltransferase [Alkaliphilus transvaalensis]
MIKVDNLYKLSKLENVTNDNCPSFSGIVAGECKGDLWVDEIDNPQIAIVSSYAVGSFAFLGTINNDHEYMCLNNFIKNEIFDFLKQKGVNCFEFSIESDNFKPYILRMFKKKTIQREKEYSFRKTEQLDINYSLPDGFTMQRVDYSFWKKIVNGDFENENFLTKRLLESWGNFDNFISKSLAFSITYSNKIVSVIVGTARFKNVIPIDIETDDKFKRKGFGYYLTVEFVNECFNKGLVVQWDCVESNANSCKLAEKAKLKLFRENEVYWFDI